MDSTFRQLTGSIDKSINIWLIDEENKEPIDICSNLRGALLWLADPASEQLRRLLSDNVGLLTELTYLDFYKDNEWLLMEQYFMSVEKYIRFATNRTLPSYYILQARISLESYFDLFNSDIKQYQKYIEFNKSILKHTFRREWEH